LMDERAAACARNMAWRLGSTEFRDTVKKKRPNWRGAQVLPFRRRVIGEPMRERANSNATATQSTSSLL
jgi:hypothetical protein